METSTGREIERIPARRSRADSHGGVGAVASMPVTVRATKRVHPGWPWIGASSSRTTGNPSAVGTGTRAATAPAGSGKGSCTAWLLTVGPTAGLDPDSYIHSKYIVIWACNSVSTNLHHWAIVKDAQKKGAKVVVIDTYASRTAKAAD